mmetsp:Transcript_60529/g.155963  ORF Transcript_60529/g.155963 Transcript_60529/m.155963 type:complete len:280 (+) Transcript_60529:183-1022(+)
MKPETSTDGRRLLRRHRRCYGLLPELVGLHHLEVLLQFIRDLEKINGADVLRNIVLGLLVGVDEHGHLHALVGELGVDEDLAQLVGLPQVALLQDVKLVRIIVPAHEEPRGKRAELLVGRFQVQSRPDGRLHLPALLLQRGYVRVRVRLRRPRLHPAVRAPLRIATVERLDVVGARQSVRRLRLHGRDGADSEQGGHAGAAAEALAVQGSRHLAGIAGSAAGRRRNPGRQREAAQQRPARGGDSKPPPEWPAGRPEGHRHSRHRPRAGPVNQTSLGNSL